MKKLLKISVLLLAMGLVFGLVGCDDPENEGGGDYDQYYDGSFKNNRNGTTEVVNNTSSDMLLFTGEVISKNYIVGGVKAGTTNTLNFSNETDYQVGGYKLLRAVKQREFEAAGDQSRVDHSALVVYGEGRKFRVDIRSTTDGDYHYTVYNRSRDYGLELRRNAPEGEKVAYLTKGEVRREIKSSTINELTLYPVWVAFNNQTKSIVTFTPSGPLSALDVQPKRENDEESPYYFPADGTSTNIVFPDVQLPFATIQVRNNGSLTANFRVANTIRTPESGYTGISSGSRESYEIRSSGEGLNLNLAMAQGQIVVPVRFEDTPNEVTVTIENGYVYTVALNLVPNGDPGEQSDYRAWLVKGDAINTQDLLVSN
jgi:hypothetical protein